MWCECGVANRRPCAQGKGAELRQAWKREDNLVWPVLVDKVTDDMRLCWEEPFGPVVPVVRVGSEEEALRYVNESKYGLQGGRVLVVQVVKSVDPLSLKVALVSNI